MHAPLTYGDVHDRTFDRIHDLSTRGYAVHLIWGHEIRRMLRKNADFHRVWDDEQLWSCYKHTMPIRPRDALSGGRTEAIRALAELSKEQVAEGWRILHLDITR